MVRLPYEIEINEQMQKEVYDLLCNAATDRYGKKWIIKCTSENYLKFHK